jgi:hypothetical protein
VISVVGGSFCVVSREQSVVPTAKYVVLRIVSRLTLLKDRSIEFETDQLDVPSG